MSPDAEQRWVAQFVSDLASCWLAQQDGVRTNGVQATGGNRAESLGNRFKTDDNNVDDDDGMNCC